MNSTPDFDRVSTTIPIEGNGKLRAFALLRLICVTMAFLFCVADLIGFSPPLPIKSSYVIVIGLWIGLGVYGDGTERLWAKLGPVGRFAFFALLLIVLAGLLLTKGGPFWSVAIAVCVMSLLVAKAVGLLEILRNPSRAARFRQMVRYIRSVPGKERQAARKRMQLNFETLVAEGFN